MSGASCVCDEPSRGAVTTVLEHLDERREAALVSRLVMGHCVTETRAVTGHQITDVVLAILNVAIEKDANHAVSVMQPRAPRGTLGRSSPHCQGTADSSYTISTECCDFSLRASRMDRRS